MTDSEPVPRGKGEKHPCQGSETDLKPCAYKLLRPLGVAACLLHNESASHHVRRVNPQWGSRSESES